jgi:hypothetical protein
MSGTRTRITTTIRHDNPVRRKRGKKKSGTLAILVILMLGLGILVVKKTQHAGPHARVASVAH